MRDQFRPFSVCMASGNDGKWTRSRGKTTRDMTGPKLLRVSIDQSTRPNVLTVLIDSSGFMKEARFQSCIPFELMIVPSGYRTYSDCFYNNRVQHIVRLTCYGLSVHWYPRLFLDTGSLSTIQSNTPETCVRRAQVECQRSDWLKKQQLVTRWL